MKITLLKNNTAPAFLGEDYNISYSQAYSIICDASQKIPANVSRIAIFAENSPQWPCALYAGWMSKCSVVPMDAGLTVAEAAFILSDSEAEFLFTSKSNLEKAKEAIALTGKEISFFLLEDISSPITAQAPDDWKIECLRTDLALIVYTSGTTSNPKGVMLTFNNLKANIDGVVDDGYYYTNMRTLAMLPLHHILPLVGTVIGVLYVGGSMVFPKSVAPADIGSVMRKHKVTMVISVPRFYELVHANIMEKVNKSPIIKALFLLAKCVGSLRFSQILFGSVHKKFGGAVKFWVTGGAALDKCAWADLVTMGFNVCEGYGMTEAAPIISFPRQGKVKIGSPGQGLLGNEIRIVDGEITVRGESITSGYYKRETENEETFKNGWLYTGDLGYIDDDGYLFVTGRRKEIIVLPNGKKLNPIEIEAQLKEKSKEIEEVGVLVYEEVLQAVIRVSEEYLKNVGEENINTVVRENIILPYNRAVVAYKRIMRFTVSTKEFPRTRIGKLKRFQLPSFIESINTDLPEKSVFKPEPESQIYEDLKNFMAMQLSVPITADAHLEMDLGLDSLGKISFQELIKESYNVQMKEEDFEKYSSLRMITEYIESETNKPKEETKTKYLSWGEILSSHNGPKPKISKPYFFHLFTLLISRYYLPYRYTLEVSGLENIPAKGPVIIAPNHQSLCDGFFFATKIPIKRIWGIYFFAKIREMMKSNLMKFFVRHSNIVVVDIKSNVRESLMCLAEILKNKKSVTIFPEGTRSRDGEVAEFKQTFAILAKELDVEVVPAVISGAYEGLTTRAALPQKGTKITIKFLPPVKVGKDERYKEFAARVREIVVKEKAAIEGKEYIANQD